MVKDAQEAVRDVRGAVMVADGVERFIIITATMNYGERNQKARTEGEDEASV